MPTVKNCWEFMRCGREEGGVKADKLGVCLAYTLGAGQACWEVAGTVCGEDVKGTYAKRKVSCVDCDFFRLFDLDHQFWAWERFSPYRAGRQNREVQENPS